ncbi:MAG: hypothetical protein WBP41_14460, partial [Saprospiraceae bacterium]
DPEVYDNADDNEICEGGQTTLHSEIIGGAGINIYQWQQLSGGVWSNIFNANGPDYTTEILNAGTYSYRVFVIQDSGCEGVSDGEDIVVNNDPQIFLNSEDNEICEGGVTTIYSVVVGGAGMNFYQWQELSGNVWVDIFGANGENYTTEILGEGSYTYRLIVNQDAGCSSESAGETIIVNGDPEVYDNADFNQICEGGSAILQSEVVGGAGGNNYQWQELSGGIWIDIFGANADNYTTEILPPGSYSYRVIVNQDAGCEGISDGETIVVTGDPQVFDNADDNEFCSGGSTTLHTTVVGGAGGNNYQWQTLIGGIWVDIFGATGADYTTDVLDAGTYTYRVVVVQNGGCEDVSDGQTIVVIPDPEVIVNADDNEFCDGGSTSIHAQVIGGAGAANYQWQQLIQGLWIDLFLANSSDYTTDILDAGTYTYRVVVTQDAGCETISSNVLLVVNGDPVVTDNADQNSICNGGIAMLHSQVVGGAGLNNYQWQQLVGGIWIDIFSANSANYTTGSLSIGSYTYRVVVTQDAGCEAASGGQTINVTPDLSVTSQPSNVNECVGGSNTMIVIVTGGAGIITYQWQSSSNGTTGWVNATGLGATTTIYTPSSAIPGTTFYRVLVNAANNGCDQAVSNNATAIITQDLVITTQPTNINECVGGTNAMSVVVTGGSGTISYQWQSSADGISGWANAAGAGSTTAIFTPPSTVAGTTFYRVLINASNSGCDQAVSSTSATIIAPDIVVTTPPANINECIGGTNTMNVVVTGGSGTISYQWQSSADGSTGWANATGPGATTSIYTPSSAIAGTTFYRVLINAANNGCDQAVSNNATAIIAADLVVTTQPTNVSECIGGTNTMTVTVTGGSGTISYQWQSSADGSTGWANATGLGATTNTYTPPSVVAGTTFYRVLVNAVNNGCDQAVSNNATAVITADLVVTTQPTNVSECIGGTNTMNVVVTGGSGTISYQW